MKEDSLLAVTASSYVELESFQCSQRPVSLRKVLYFAIIRRSRDLEVRLRLGSEIAVGK